MSQHTNFTGYTIVVTNEDPALHLVVADAAPATICDMCAGDKDSTKNQAAVYEVAPADVQSEAFEAWLPRYCQPHMVLAATVWGPSLGEVWTALQAA